MVDDDSVVLISVREFSARLTDVKAGNPPRQLVTSVAIEFLYNKNDNIYEKLKNQISTQKKTIRS